MRNSLRCTVVMPWMQEFNRLDATQMLSGSGCDAVSLYNTGNERGAVNDDSICNIGKLC